MRIASRLKIRTVILAILCTWVVLCTLFQSIKRVFRGQLGFEVLELNDKKVSEIRLEMAKLQASKEKMSCLAVFVLTHGGN